MPIVLRHRDHLLWPRFALGFCAVLLVIGCLRSADMVALAYDLPESGFSSVIVQGAENWHGWMELTGMAEISEGVSDLSNAAHEARVTEDTL